MSLLSHGCNLPGDDVDLCGGSSVNHGLMFVVLMNGTSSVRWMYCFFKLAREPLMYLAGADVDCGRTAECRLFLTVPLLCIHQCTICCSKNTFPKTPVAGLHKSNDLLKKKSCMYIDMRHTRQLHRNGNALSQLEHPLLWSETV